MKIKIALTSPVITQVLEQVLTACDHVVVSSTEEADLVIAEAPGEALWALQAGKRVVQFVAWPGVAPSASDLVADPAYADRLKVFAPPERGPGFSLEWLDNFMKFLLEELGVGANKKDPS